ARSSTSLRRAHTATFAPLLANRSTHARPSPSLPPVTIATLPARPSSRTSMIASRSRIDRTYQTTGPRYSPPPETPCPRRPTGRDYCPVLVARLACPDGRSASGRGRPDGPMRPIIGSFSAGGFTSTPKLSVSRLTSIPSSHPTATPVSPKSESCTPVPLGVVSATEPGRKSFPIAVDGSFSRSSGTLRPTQAVNVLLLGPGQVR